MILAVMVYLDLVLLLFFFSLIKNTKRLYQQKRGIYNRCTSCPLTPKVLQECTGKREHPRKISSL